MMAARFAACLAFWLWLGPPAHAAGEILPFQGGGAATPVEEDESRVWSQAAEFDQALEKSGSLYRDEALAAYVQGVMDKLFPEFNGRVRVRIVKSPSLNAFALPNGSIYINQGLLARFDNEAQLATVLAHEGTHFVNRHSFRSQQNVKSSTAFATVSRILGIPVIGDILAMSSIFGYSREMETEADNDGYRRLAAAGYSVREAPKVFEHLVAELKASDIKEPYFFSSHPQLQERIDNFSRLSENAAAKNGVFRDEYVRRMGALRIANLEAELSMGRAKSVLLVLGDPVRFADYPLFAHYHLGEAYRLRDEEGDAARAEESYKRAIGAAPGFAPSYRALGVLYFKRGASEDAEKNLAKYLELAPVAADRKYIELYLENIRKQREKP